MSGVIVCKVVVCYSYTFLSAPASHRICTTQFVGDDERIQIVFVGVCLIIFRVHMNILFTIKVNIYMLDKWSYRSHNHADC